MKPTWQKLGLFESCLHDSDSGGTTTTVSDSEPWKVQQPYLETAFKGAEALRGDTREYYPGSTVAPFAPETGLALEGQTSRALSGSPLVTTAGQFATSALRGSHFNPEYGGANRYSGDVLSGQYLDPASNPFFAGVADTIMSQVKPSVDSTFARGGRTGGSPLHAQALGKGISQGLSPYLFQEYGRERGLQESTANRLFAERGRDIDLMKTAGNLAIPLGREDYFDIGKLGQVGGVREAKAGEEISDAVNRWNFEQFEPTNRLRDYVSLISGGHGTSTTQTGATTSSTNPWLLGAGAGLGLAGLPTSGGGSVGASALGTVICTELRRTGDLDELTMLAADAFGLRHPRVADGYRVWAVPVVRAMRRNKRVRAIVRTLAMPLIRKLARGGPDKTPLGMVLAAGIGICWCLGRPLPLSETANG